MRTIYNRHRQLLIDYAKSFTAGDQQRAEDLFQEAMIRAWRNAERLEADPEMVRPWLFTVVRRLAIDNHRALLSRPAEFDGSALDNLTVPDPIDQAITVQVVDRALAGLSYPHREMLVYRYFLDRSLQETAAALDIAVGTVKSRSSHALRSLRESLIALDAQ
jgi:RNA polymerase sigma-70 factor, ECF subfamily